MFFLLRCIHFLSRLLHDLPLWLLIFPCIFSKCIIVDMSIFLATFLNDRKYMYFLILHILIVTVINFFFDDSRNKKKSIEDRSGDLGGHEMFKSLGPPAASYRSIHQDNWQFIIESAPHYLWAMRRYKQIKSIIKRIKVL